MTKPTGGPAFPQPTSGVLKEGMTLRDYFAAQALPTVMQEFHKKYESEWIAYAAYKMADAMLAARKGY